MADNVAVTAGSGTTVAADEVVDGTLGTVKVQYVKLMDGTLDGTGKALVDSKGLSTQHISGAVASGAYAAGSLAAGAGVDGWDLTQGAIADAAVTAGATGSISAKLRSVSRDIGSLVTAWGSTLLDFGSGTSGSRTQRVIVDSAQLAALNTTAQAMSAGFQLTDVPTDGTAAVRTGSLTETAPTTDTASSGLNGRLQRIAQRLTTLLLPSATGNGLTDSRVNAANTTNATSLKGSAGQIYEIDVYNVAAYTVFLKLYNKASAPTVGSDTPVMTIPIPAGGGYSKEFAFGKTFATGVAYAITKLQADADTTVVAAGDLTGAISWI